MPRTTSPEGARRPAPPEAPSWLLLAVAFSPVLIDQVAHLGERPWAGYCVVFLLLFLDQLRRAPWTPRHPGAGWAVLLAALAIELLLVRGGVTRAARPSLAVGALGMALLLGRPGPRTIALLLAFVPVPHALVSAASPALEAGLARLAAGLLRIGGLSALVEASRYTATLHTRGGALPLIDADGGVVLAALLVGLVWYAGCQRGWSLAGTLARGALLVWLAFPIQVLALAVAGAAVGHVAPERLRGALDIAPWAVVTLVALAGPLRPTRRRPGPPTERLSSAAP